MQTITVDKTGKAYLPKAIRKEAKDTKYMVINFPDGTMTWYPIKKFKNAEDALAWIKQNPVRLKTPAAEARKTALEQAYNDYKGEKASD